jgi:predicted phosphodiesterase
LFLRLRFGLLFVCWEIVMVRFVFVCLVVIGVAGFAVGEIGFSAGPYLQMPGETSVSVMWITSVKSTATVEYGTGDVLDKKVVANHDGQIDANTRVHRVDITGLKPSSTYNYRVTSTEILKYAPYKVTFGEKINSDTLTFTTLDTKKADCSFIVINDVHSNVANLKARIEQANKKPYEMVFLNGDIIQDPGSESIIVDTLLKPMSDLIAGRIPMLFARGNHEIRGEYSRLVKNYFALPNDKFYFSFKHGPVYFVVLDCGEDKEDSHWAYSGLNSFEGYRNEQAEWLKKEIEKKEFKDSPFRVVLTHIPLFAGRDKFGKIDCQEKWAALLNKGKADLHISGHTHMPAIVDAAPGVHDYPVIIGGGPGDDDYTVIRVDATKKTLDVTMTNAAGEVIGKYQGKAKKKGLF